MFAHGGEGEAFELASAISPLLVPGSVLVEDQVAERVADDPGAVLGARLDDVRVVPDHQHGAGFDGGSANCCWVICGFAAYSTPACIETIVTLAVFRMAATSSRRRTMSIPLIRLSSSLWFPFF